MTENNDLSQLPEEPTRELPGKRLRAARESNGLTREQVAAQLRLNVRLITALEEDDYDALPAQTFTSGYLRSYARLLGMPEHSFVAPAPAKHQPPLLVTTSTAREISSRSGIARLATYLIIGVMIVSVAMWWTGRQEEVAPQARVTAPEVVEPQAELSSDVADAGEELSPGLPDNTSSSTEMETSLAQVQHDEAPGDESLGNDSLKEEQVAGSGTSEDVMPVPRETPAPTVVAKRLTPQQPEPPPLTDAMPQSKLELRFESDSWTEVKDNAGRQLLYRLIKADETLVLRGEAPFHVFLGYAPGVTVYYNDELFDHSAFQRRDVARFRLGRAEHNHPGSR